MTYQSTVLADNPIRYYRLGEASGTVATDLGSQVQNGTLNGGITLSQTGLLVGDSDTAMLFNGSTGYISLPTTSLPTGAAAWSVDCWVTFTSVPGAGNYPVATQLGSRVASEDVQIFFNGDQQKLGVAVDTIADLLATLTVTSGHIYYCAATYDGTTLTFYVYDATAGTSTSVSGARTLSLLYGVARIGLDDSLSLYWPGIIDEVAFYSTTLTSAQVAAHYTAGTTAPALLQPRYAPRIPRALGGTIIPEQVSRPHPYVARALGSTVIYEDRTFIPRALGGTYIPDTVMWVPRALGGTIILAPTFIEVLTVSDRVIFTSTQVPADALTGTDTSISQDGATFTEANTATDTILGQDTGLFIETNTASDTFLSTDAGVFTEANSTTDSILGTGNALPTNGLSTTDSETVQRTYLPLDILASTDIGSLEAWQVEALTVSESTIYSATALPIDANSASDSVLSTDGALFTEANVAGDPFLAGQAGAFIESLATSDSVSTGGSFLPIEGLSAPDALLDTDAYLPVDAIPVADSSSMTQQGAGNITMTFEDDLAFVESFIFTLSQTLSDGLTSPVETIAETLTFSTTEVSSLTDGSTVLPIPRIVTLGLDSFVRSNQSGFGTASDGQVWSSADLGDGTYSIASNEGTIVSGTASNTHVHLGSTTSVDAHGLVRWKTTTAIADGGYIILRATTPDSTFYRARQSNGSFFVEKSVSSTLTTLSSITFTITTSTFYWIRFEIVGSSLRAKQWPDGTAEPAAWTINTQTDTAITAAGNIGLGERAGAASHTINLDSFYVVDYALQDSCFLADVSTVTEVTNLADIGLTPTESLSANPIFVSADTLVETETLTKGGLFTLSDTTSLVDASGMTEVFLGDLMSTQLSWLHVENGRIVNVPHQPVYLRGLNTAGLEFGDGIADFTQARINAFASKFSMNLWRLAINVAWWNNNVLMTDGVTHYQDWIQQVIGWMKATGCYVEIDPTTYVTMPPANSGSYCGSGVRETLVAADTFTRANQSGWGTASGGGTYTTLGHAATLSIASNEGVLTGTSAVDTYVKLGSGTATDQTALVRLAVTQTTSAYGGVMLRFTDANNWYRASFHPGGDIVLDRMVGGVYQQRMNAFYSLNSGTYYWIRFYVVGNSPSTLYMRIWADGTTEPNEWSITVSDSSGLSSGGYGLFGNTSTADQVQFDHFTVATPVTSCITSQDTLNFPPWTDTQIISATNTFYTSFLGIYGSDPAILYDALNEPKFVPFVADVPGANTAVITHIQALQPNALIFVYDGDMLYYARRNDADHYPQSNLVWDLHLYDDPTWTWQQKLIDYQVVFDYAHALNHAATIGEWNTNTANDPNGMGAAWANLAITQGIANTYYNADNLLLSDNATLTAQGLIAQTTFQAIAAFPQNDSQLSSTDALTFGYPDLTTLCNDTFVRQNQTPWGTASDGQVWSPLDSGNITFSIVGNKGQGTGGTIVLNYAHLGNTVSVDASMLLRFQSVSAVGDGAYLMMRETPTTKTFYRFRYTNSAVDISKSVNSTITALTTVAFTFTMGTWYWLRFDVVGSNFRGKIWQDGTAEPPAWTINSITDTSITGTGNLGIGIRLGAPVHVVQVDSFYAVDYALRDLLTVVEINTLTNAASPFTTDDILQSSDGLSFTCVYQPTEALTVDESTSSFTEVFVPTDVLTLAETFTTPSTTLLTDTPVLSEVLSITLSESLTETLTVSESLVPVPILVATDALTTSESASYILAFSSIDTPTLVESCTIAVTASFTDPVLATVESLTEVLSFSSIDVLSTLESLADTIAFSILEVLTLVETSVTTELSSVIDALALAEVFSSSETFIPIESLTQVESVTESLSYSVIESITLIDASQLANVLSGADTLSVSEVVAEAVTFVPIETMIVNEGTTPFTEVFSALDTLTLVDLSQLQPGPFIFTDVFSPAETFTVTEILFNTDALVPVETLSTALVESLTESLILSDVTTINPVIIQVDTLAVNETWKPIDVPILVDTLVSVESLALTLALSTTESMTSADTSTVTILTQQTESLTVVEIGTTIPVFVPVDALNGIESFFTAEILVPVESLSLVDASTRVEAYSTIESLVVSESILGTPVFIPIDILSLMDVFKSTETLVPIEAMTVSNLSILIGSYITIESLLPSEILLEVETFVPTDVLTTVESITPSVGIPAALSTDTSVVTETLAETETFKPTDSPLLTDASIFSIAWSQSDASTIVEIFIPTLVIRVSDSLAVTETMTFIIVVVMPSIVFVRDGMGAVKVRDGTGGVTVRDGTGVVTTH